MKVDSQEYQVYPDIRSLTGTGKERIDSTKYRKELDKLQNMQQSIAIHRQITLKQFYERFVHSIKKEAGNKGKVTKAQLDSAFKNSVAELKEHFENQERQDKLIETISGFRSELQQMKDQEAAIRKASHKKAGMMLGLGMLGTTAQLIGFTTGIYVISDWNEMEPWTWIFQAFYMMVGSWYFMATRADWDYTQIYHTQQERAQDSQT